MFKTPLPKCKKCGKFIKTGNCITFKSIDDFFPGGPEYFEDLEPYHLKCWNETFPDKQIIENPL